jgi:hypothetical protein
VSVRIVGFTQQLFIPSYVLSIPMSGFNTTLPRESLGIPQAGTVTAC